MGKWSSFQERDQKHTDIVQLFAIFNQVTSFQRSNVTPAPAVICAHLKCKNINPQYFSFPGCFGSYMYDIMSLFSRQRTTEPLVVSH